MEFAIFQPYVVVEQMINQNKKKMSKEFIYLRII